MRTLIFILTVLFFDVFADASDTVIISEDFQSPLPGWQVVPSGREDFPKALEIRASRMAEAKFDPELWQTQLFKTGDAEVLEIDYLLQAEVPGEGHGLLVNGGDKQAIILRLRNGVFQLAMPGRRKFKDFCPVRPGEWHRIRYRVDPLRSRFDLFIDDFDTPVAANNAFRDTAIMDRIRVWALGSYRSAAAVRLTGITVKSHSGDKFPPPALLEAPWFVTDVLELAQPPVPADFERISAIALSPANGLAREKASARILRDTKNLYIKFDLDSDVPQKRDADSKQSFFDRDIWEFFLTTSEEEVYWHFAGDASGNRYSSRRIATEILARDFEDWYVETTINRTGWSALVVIPFSLLGAAPTANQVWRANFGRENPHSLNGREVLSWTNLRTFHSPDRFGYLTFVPSTYTRSERLAELAQRRFEPEQVAARIEFRSELPDIAPEALLRLGRDLEQKTEACQRELRLNPPICKLPELIRTASELELLQEKFRRNAEAAAILFAPGTVASERGFAGHFLPAAYRITGNSVFGEGTIAPELLLSGNEYGSLQFQLQAAPGRSFSSISVELKPIADESGRALASARSTIYRVEWIQTAMPDRPPELAGDLLIPGNRFELDSCESAALWLDFYLPPGTPRGEYWTQIKVTPEGFPSLTKDICITATGLELPKHASLDTAFCFDYRWAEDYYGEKISAQALINFCRFILEHHLEPMNLWLHTDTDIGRAALDYCAANGKTMLFLRIHKDPRAKFGETTELINKYPELRPILYGYDEVLLSKIPGILERMKQDFSLVKELFPDVPRHCTAAIDPRLYGVVDIWCPRFDQFDPASARERQATNGEQVWWYNTDYPLSPYPNFNLDSPGIDPRIIPWINWKFGITGLLHWGLNSGWRHNTVREYRLLTPEFLSRRSMDWATPEVLEKIRSGKMKFPQVPWIPYFRDQITKQVSETNGGGNLMYPGPDWEPWPSVRLKNLRDGLQDYEYLVLLRDSLKHVTNPKQLAVSNKLLEIPTRVVDNMNDYTVDVATLLDVRKQIIDQIIENHTTKK